MVSSTSDFFKDYHNCTSPKDECNLKSLKNSQVLFFQIARETILLLVKKFALYFIFLHCISFFGIVFRKNCTAFSRSELRNSEMVSSAIWIKHARVSFSKSIKIAQTRVLVLSKFHEKPSYYVLIIYIKMFETIVVLAYVDTANRPLTKFSWLCYVTLYNANSFKKL